MSPSIDTDWDISDLPLDGCVAPRPDDDGCCGDAACHIDTLGLPWCERDEVRKEFLDWGVEHNWPALHREGYAVARGMFYWVIAAILGEEEMILMLL